MTRANPGCPCSCAPGRTLCQPNRKRRKSAALTGSISRRSPSSMRRWIRASSAAFAPLQVLAQLRHEPAAQDAAGELDLRQSAVDIGGRDAQQRARAGRRGRSQDRQVPAHDLGQRTSRVRPDWARGAPVARRRRARTGGPATLPPPASAARPRPTGGASPPSSRAARRARDELLEEIARTRARGRSPREARPGPARGRAARRRRARQARLVLDRRDGLGIEAADARRRPRPAARAAR